MKRSNPNSYPVTFAFEEYLIDNGVLKLDGDQLDFRGSEAYPAVVGATAAALHEMLGEYEHGTADLEELFKLREGDALMFHLTQEGEAVDFDQELPDEEDQRRRKLALAQLRGIYEDIIATMING